MSGIQGKRTVVRIPDVSDERSFFVDDCEGVKKALNANSVFV